MARQANMTAETYSIEQAAQLITGSDTPAKVRWVRVRLARGDFTGYKANHRRWRMTEDDVTAAIEALRPKRFVPSVPNPAGLTRTSARRLAS